MDQVITRKATVADLEELYRFEQGVIAAERPYDSTLKKGTIYYYDLTEMLKDSAVEIIVAEINGKIIGSGYARIEEAKPYLRHAQHAYLGFMYVDPGYRGKGVNRKVIEALKIWAVSQNVKEFRLEVYFDNTAAIKAYEKTGFSKHMIEMRLNLEEL